MSERKLVDRVVTLLKGHLPQGCTVRKGANLYYRIPLRSDEKTCVASWDRPSRGRTAFQTDLCIFRLKKGHEIPRVVIEFKRGMTTHDVITYSDKALRHKQVYRWLRYGMVSFGLDAIPSRFFLHNEGLDFCLAIKDPRDERHLRSRLDFLVESQVKISDELESLQFRGRNKLANYFGTSVKFCLLT